MNLETKIAVISAGAAVISALIAWQSSISARRALRIAKLDHEEQHGNINCYLIDSFRWKNKNGEQVVSFACSYTNTASAQNAIAKVELVIYAVDQEGRVTEAILQPIIEKSPNEGSLKKLPDSIKLEPKETVSGWVSFVLPKFLLDQRRIDKYEVIGQTADGERISIEAFLLRTLRNVDL